MNGIEQYLYLVVNRENNFIYSICNNCSIANALSKGFINSSIMAIPYSLFNRPLYINDYLKSEKVTCKLITKLRFSGVDSNLGEKVEEILSGKLFDVAFVETEISEEWLKTRKIANVRTLMLTNLEHRMKRYLSRHKEFFYDDCFYNFLSEEFEKCSPSEEVFSVLISQYAKTIKMTPKETFYHLKMKYDTFKAGVFRHHALWEKYVDKINKLEQEQISLYQNLEFEMTGMNRD